ncbi:Aquaporin AQPAe.a [Portunus trituberculatus]|uniref:Aquaporin AQPAe.a n=1 Tax=Portunus trituberculatus TaxID=210409 RepID=A0A5B7EUH3_PORTR|nr:Aquaporin AQPAe.a [Portunus trituberculatus]
MEKKKNVQEIFGLSEMKTWALWRAVVAELIGTMMLVLVVTASVLSWTPVAAPPVVQISLAVGLVVASMAQMEASYIITCSVGSAITAVRTDR